ncbi:MAG: hypothetical protein OEV81_16375 [Betaproteobacteria bacterium]|nr:hypothetical protein [Betaproteobacteria bacterium]MDH5222993.1 hypothetical protein [Betaproteobacteria bacterium]MDH5351774.1 hypothetical protein [Betaproteobacteria bacterium]
MGTVPIYRLPLLVLGFVSLALGVAGGLARLGAAIPAPPAATALHGALMVSGFLGTVIGLERAVALGRLWAYGAPLASGAGGICLILGLAVPGFALMALGAALLVAASSAVLVRQPSLEMATLLAGAIAWLAGNLFLYAGLPAVPWWIAFFALTIGGERLELSRYLKRPPAVRLQFLVLVILLLVTPLEPRTLGLALVLLAAWLLAYDLARVTVRQQGLARYIALCLLSGYAWLALGGALLAAAFAYDAALHAIFVGFVFSMVFGHAPVILPAVLRVKLPYHPVLYAPLGLLHASLLARVLFPAPLGAWGNAAAVALYIVTAATLVFRRAPDAFSRRA